MESAEIRGGKHGNVSTEMLFVAIHSTDRDFEEHVILVQDSVRCPSGAVTLSYVGGYFLSGKNSFLYADATTSTTWTSE